MRRSHRISRATLAVAFALFAGAPLAAHDTWMLPAHAEAKAGDTMRLALTSGMAFPADETAIDGARVARGAVRLAGAEAPLTTQRKSEHALELEAVLAKPGVATLWLELHPRRIELDDEQVVEYLAEIGAEDSVRQRWQTMPAPRKWRELYAKHAKTFVRVGSAGEDRSWAQPAGMGLELVPEQDPTTLASGDTLRVRLLRDGAPAGSSRSASCARARPRGRCRRPTVRGGRPFVCKGKGGGSSA